MTEGGAMVLLGDCLELMRGLPDNSVDAVVCDPPYGLGFMGKKWDAMPPGEDWAREVLRVCKPGAHLIAFGGTRTVHRLAVAVEDGGWEIRDTIHWCYWSGFPKSHDVSKAIDRAAGAKREVVGQGVGRTGEASQPHGSSFSDDGYQWPGRYDITAPATPDARTWEGWGTALKPAIEPAILARKPLEGTVAQNVLKWGTGALNIDGCRFAPGAPEWPGPQNGAPSTHAQGADAANSRETLHASWRGMETHQTAGQALGRWPANLIHCPKTNRAERERGCDGLPPKGGAEAVGRQEGSAGLQNPRAGAGRTSKGVRNFHPTVKPVRLLRWLCRLVTPPGGLVLDPFAGSGSCGVAAVLEGFRYTGMELGADYHRIAEARVAHAATFPHSWADTEPGRAEKVKDADFRERVILNGQRDLFG